MSASKHRLYFLVQLVAHRLKVRADRELKASAGLTTAQAAALSVVAKYGPVSQRFVADKLSQRESAIMTMAIRLVEAGCIDRNKSPTDGRAWELVVTDKGLEALEQLSPAFTKINNLLENELEPNAIDMFARNLKTILAALAE